ncbi:hypothetical protein BDZ97DRAFT_1754462 [Flammula alnicola]|nr:hypothetical protein BDZ97DRAFT_1754462 [Flammula alnicola]
MPKEGLPSQNVKYKKGRRHGTPYRRDRFQKDRIAEARLSRSRFPAREPESDTNIHNVGINGGHFTNARGHCTNLTINLHQEGLGILDDGTPKDTGDSGASMESEQETNITVQQSSDIYYRHLAVKKRGYPLWLPEPNFYLPIQYQRKGIAVGDVGIITASGGFDFLFNICLPHDHIINLGRVPEGFTPLHPAFDLNDVRGQLEFRADSYITSASVRRTWSDDGDGYVLCFRDGQTCSDVRTVYGSGLTFETSASEGAILAIPHGALSIDLGNITRFRNYMAANVERWYQYANGPRGREARNGDLRLVIGCDKTTAWGMATFANCSKQKESRLKFKPTRRYSDPRGLAYGWEYSGTAEVKTGPDVRELEALRAGPSDSEGSRAYENQCLFVRTLNATFREDVWEKVAFECGMGQIHGDINASNLYLPFHSRHPPGSLSGPSTYLYMSTSDSGRQAGLHHTSIPVISTPQISSISTLGSFSTGMTLPNRSAGIRSNLSIADIFKSAASGITFIVLIIVGIAFIRRRRLAKILKGERRVNSADSVSTASSADKALELSSGIGNSGSNSVSGLGLNKASSTSSMPAANEEPVEVHRDRGVPSCGIPGSIDPEPLVQPHNLHAGVTPAHPSTLLNETLLNQNPTARIAITEDKDWIRAITEDDAVLPPSERLVERVLEERHVCLEPDGLVYLKPIVKLRDGTSYRRPRLQVLYSRASGCLKRLVAPLRGQGIRGRLWDLGDPICRLVVLEQALGSCGVGKVGEARFYDGRRDDGRVDGVHPDPEDCGG